MKHKLEKYDKLITAGLVVIAFIFGIGWWFAEEKSEPVYLSKIDRLMFDKDNKAPRFVLTLPDKFMLKTAAQTSQINLDALPKEASKEDNLPEEPFSLDKLIADVPSLFKLPTQKPSYQLSSPDLEEDLTEKTDDGKVLPTIAADGRRPWIEYGHTVKIQPNFKKVALVFSGLGLDATTANQISEVFDSEVSLSFTPYITSVSSISTARQNGHETYMDLILASKDFLKEDTGPLSINLNLPLDVNIDRFRKTLDKSVPIGGIIIRDGAIQNTSIILDSLFGEAQKRGLLVVDATEEDSLFKSKADGLARRKADIVIHKDMTAEAIEKALQSAETIAFDKGQVLIVADPKPLAAVILHKWIQTFSPQVSYEEAKTIDISKPFALVPLSNLVVE